MRYWIMKSEPSEFSIVDLQKVGVEPWDGIRNYQVRNMFRDKFSKGDKAFFYHSNADVIGIVGEMKIVSRAYPDPTQFDSKNAHFDPKANRDKPTWLLVDVQFVRKFPETITLQKLKDDPYFATLPIVQKGNRLSVVEITTEHYSRIKELTKK